METVNISTRKTNKKFVAVCAIASHPVFLATLERDRMFVIPYECNNTVPYLGRYFTRLVTVFTPINKIYRS